MAYVTKQDMVERFGELDIVRLTDRESRPPKVIVDAVLDRAITDAVGVAEGYVRKAYALPLASIPAALSRAVADIAFYYLHGRASGDKDSPVAVGYRDALAWLRDVSAGKVTLDTGAVPAAPAGAGAVRLTPSSREMTRDSLRGL